MNSGVFEQNTVFLVFFYPSERRMTAFGRLGAVYPFDSSWQIMNSDPTCFSFLGLCYCILFLPI